MTSLLAESRHVHEVGGEPVFSFRLPDGVTVPVYAEQVPTLVIEQHGNHGRSRVRMTLAVELEVNGEPGHLKNCLATSLAQTISGLRQKVNGLTVQLRDSRDGTVSVPQERSASK